MVGPEDREDTRVFREIARTGEALEKLSFLKGAPTDRARILILWDQQSRWSAGFAQTGLGGAMDPLPVLESHYLSLFQRGIRVDLKDMDAPLEGYEDETDSGNGFAPMSKTADMCSRPASGASWTGTACAGWAARPTP